MKLAYPTVLRHVEVLHQLQSNSSECRTMASSCTKGFTLAKFDVEAACTTRKTIGSNCSLRKFTRNTFKWKKNLSQVMQKQVGCRSVVKCEASKPSTLPDALLFDCDGVLVDTERDGHRISFNEAFRQKGLDVDWDVELYGELLKIGGGKERMTHYFNKNGWPPSLSSLSDEGKKIAIAELHKLKTSLFMQMVETGALPLRPGVARLVDEALDNSVKVAVCSTSNEKAVSAIVREMLGEQRASHIQIFAGDIVPKKKPDPAIYILASETLDVPPSRCIVVEDSHIGLKAAKSAGMKCVITKSGYTADEDFTLADAVFNEIGNSARDGFDLSVVANILST